MSTTPDGVRNIEQLPDEPDARTHNANDSGDDIRVAPSDRAVNGLHGTAGTNVPRASFRRLTLNRPDRLQVACPVVAAFRLTLNRPDQGTPDYRSARQAGFPFVAAAAASTYTRAVSFRRPFIVGVGSAMVLFDIAVGYVRHSGLPPADLKNDQRFHRPRRPDKPDQIVADVHFDHERGLYTKACTLALSTATVGALIRYTTDGSMPTATAGTLYTVPIGIDDTTVVHAIGYKAGLTSTVVGAQTYIFPANVLRQSELRSGYPNPKEPISNPGPHEIDVPLTYGMDENVVNDPQYAREALQGLSQIPSVSVGVNQGTIFGPNGFYDTPRGPDETKHVISFEYIDPNSSEHNVGVIAAISGHSKQKLKRSFHVHFGTKYGGPAKLDAHIFDSAPVGGRNATHQFDDLILRAGNNRSWATTGWPAKTTYTEDEFVRQTQIAMTGRGVHGTFVHLYINGIYWGLYNLVERPDHGYGAAYYDAKKGDYFSISQNGVSSGDATRWNYMIDTLCRQDLSVAANYMEMRRYLNVKQFADYLIGQWFCGVSDWPGSNYWAGGDTSKKQPFQFYAWDGEEMIDTVNRFKTVPHGPWVHPYFTRTPIKSGSPIVRLWTALKQSSDFMAMFADEVRYNISDNGPLSDANALARWHLLNDSISIAIVDESARWGDATRSTGRPVYKKDAWIKATEEIAHDLHGADAKFVAALGAEGYYP